MIVEEAHLKERVYRLADLLEQARDTSHFPFTISALAISQKRERAAQDAAALLAELESEGLTINADDPRQIEIMNELFLLYTYVYPGFWVDHSKEVTSVLWKEQE